MKKRSTITSGNYGYGGGDGDGDGDWIYGGVFGSGSASLLDFSSRGGFLYLGAFTKVVPFDDTMAAANIRADQNGPAE